MRRSIAVLVAIVASSMALNGQRPKVPIGAQPLMSTLPIWPTDGVVPPELAGRFVFLEVATGDLVVSYPSGLQGGGAVGPDSRTTFRVRLPRHVQPFLGVNVAALGDGRFAYTYRVRNGVAASDPITRWHLDVSTLADLGAEHAQKWQASMTVREPDSERLASFNAGAHVVHWSAPSAPTSGQPGPIGPGETSTGFKVISRSRPGFVSAYFQGGEITAESEVAIPETVRRQLALATTLDATTWRVQTLGPKYPPDMTAGQVASDLLADMGTLHTRKLLSDQSPFFKEVLSVLDQVVGAPQAWEEGMPEVALTTRSTGPMENELALAVRLARDSRR
jgi:hypothetical protein